MRAQIAHRARALADDDKFWSGAFRAEQIDHPVVSEEKRAKRAEMMKGLPMQ